MRSRHWIFSMVAFVMAAALAWSAVATVLKTKLTASDAAASDIFGWSVSISGDWAIVGASGDDDDGEDSGSAYLFKRDGEVWDQKQKLTAEDADASDYFGMSVSIDGYWAIVGAERNDDDGEDSGSAYIFLTRDSTSWTELAKLTAADADTQDLFGKSVSIDGEYAIVGAEQDDDDGESSGSAYIFKRDSTSWSQQAKLTALDPAAYDWFGTSVSIDGDYAIVGARGDDDGGQWSGSAYIFKREGTSWSQQQKLTAADADTADRFGYSVSISGDYAIVGAEGDTDAGYYLGSGSGSAYIFKRDGTSWTEQQKLTALDADAGDEFGTSVSIDGDYAIVGAQLDDDGGNKSGSAYIFKREGTSWSQQEDKLTADDAAAEDIFGWSVSIDDDYAIVGAPWNDDAGGGSGSAYVDFSPSTPTGIDTDTSNISVPAAFSLATARPNPFNPSTTIDYEVPEQTHVTLSIYNLLGQKVILLVDQVQAAGRYEVAWHGVNSRGAGVASGVYLYRIVSGSGYTDTKRMTLLK